MADLKQLETALRNADAAGDQKAASALAAEIKRQRGGTLTAREPSVGDRLYDAASTVLGPAKADQLRSDVSGLGAAFRGAIDGATFGTADMVRAGKKTIDEGGEFTRNLEGARAETEFIRQQNPMGFMAGNIGGSMVPAVGALKTGLTATRFVRPGVTGAKGAIARGGANAVDGAVFGAATALGHGEDPTIPTAVGALAGPVGQVTTATARAIARPFAARLAPQRYANLAIGKAVDRSGKTVDEIRNELLTAGADGQSEFMLADALGNPGQRMLSTVARTPNDARASVTEALLQRQAGQGDRLVQTLAEGFDAPDTALQRQAVMKSARSDEAGTLYDAARGSSAGVDLTPTVQTIDDLIRPGLQQSASVPSGLADDSISTQLQRFRDRMANDKEMLTDFDSIVQMKSEIGDAVETARRSGQNNRARLLSKISQSLDEQLEAASKPYRVANDTFAQRSRAIDAIDTGRSAASGRVRADDTIPRFRGLDQDAQQAFRVGYADPIIARTESAAFGVNKARPLMSRKTATEFPAFAAPGRGDKMMRNIGRENAMFETQATALGGSKTADNLADEAALSNLDPSIIGSLLTGNFKTAGVNMTSRGLAEMSGQPASVREQLGRMLLTSSPREADALMRAAITQQGRSQGLDDALIRLLIAGGATTANQGQP
jgi:hypothetical protein